MVKKLIVLLVLSSCGTAISQTGIGTAAPDPSALLELNASNKGLLLPKVALLATDQESPLSAHVQGMIVYNTATSANGGGFDVSPGMYYNDGVSWIRMTTEQPIAGDIKYGFQSTDHEGWYLLDGRATATLTPSASATAAGLGFAANLPNASDRFLKSRNGPEAIGSVGGSATFTVARANFPNVNFTGVTASGGAHTHTYVDNAATGTNYIAGSNNPLANNVAANFTTGSNGSHTHTASFSSGGSATPVSFVPSYLVTAVFIYLGK